MSDASDPKGLLRRGFSQHLRGLGLALELIAEDVIGEGDERIDWVGAGPDGRAWIVLLEPGRASARELEQGLVQRAWVEARIPDWCQLAPSLSLRAGLTPGVLLVAREHDRSTEIAAREASIRLARWRGEPSEPSLELLDPPRRPRDRVAAAAPAALASLFRTGLTDADLAN